MLGRCTDVGTLRRFGPLLLVLFFTKAFVVVSFQLEQLSKVGFAVDVSMERGIVSGGESTVTLVASKTGSLMIVDTFHHQPLHRIDRLVTGGAFVAHDGLMDYHCVSLGRGGHLVLGKRKDRNSTYTESGGESLKVI